MWLDECGEHYMSTGLVRCAQVILANLALRKEIRVREAMKKASIDIQICTLLFYLSQLWQYTSDHTHNDKLTCGATTRGTHVQTTDPVNFAIYGGTSMIVSCSEGYMPAEQNQSLVVASPGEACVNQTYVLRCGAECALEGVHGGAGSVCLRASCPPFSALGLRAGALAVDVQAQNNSVNVTCPEGFNFDSKDGPVQTTAVCQRNCQYTRPDSPAGWTDAFACNAIDCGTVDSAGNLLNSTGHVILPEPGSEILWRSDVRLHTPGEVVYLNDTFIIGCAVGYQRRGTVPPVCEFQFKVVCASDGNLRLVDAQKELEHSSAILQVLREEQDSQWQRANLARNASLRYFLTHCTNQSTGNSSSSTDARCNVSNSSGLPLVRPAPIELEFAGVPRVVYVGKTRINSSSPESLLVPISQAPVLGGLQGGRGGVASCKRLVCGCGMCPLTALSLEGLNYSLVTSGSGFQGGAGLISKMGYKQLPYVTQGSVVQMHCKRGHRVDSHDPTAARVQNGSCNVSYYDTPTSSSYGTADYLSFNSTTKACDDAEEGNPCNASAQKTWNCGIQWPAACKPVTCGSYHEPANARVVSPGWSSSRMYYYQASAGGVEVQCLPGFYASNTDPATCAQSFEVSCGSEGQWLNALTCVPLRCNLASLRDAVTNSIPDDKTIITVPGGSMYSAAEAHDVSVPFGETLSVACAQDYQRSESGTRTPKCEDKCLFSPTVVSCSPFVGSCPPWDNFELGPGVNLKSNKYLMTLQPLAALQTATLDCRDGYELDNTVADSVVLAGLESLGSLEVQAAKTYPPPARSATTNIQLPLVGASLEIPPGAWPVGVGPLSATIFDLRDDSVRRAGSLTRYGAVRRADGGVILSQTVNLGPDGSLNGPVTLKLPFDPVQAAPYRNRLFELRIWRLDVISGIWSVKPPPQGLSADQSVNWDSDPPTVTATTRSFSPYAVRATRLDLSAVQPDAQGPIIINTTAPGPPPTTLGARPQLVVTTPAPLPQAPSLPFECFNHWLCLSGVALAGLVVIAGLVLVYRATQPYCVDLVASFMVSKGAANAVSEGEEENEDERAAREAREKEQEALREQLRLKYAVKPEQEPGSLKEAQDAYAKVKRVMGSAMQTRHDKFRLDWLKAQVAYWSAAESFQRDAAKKKDVEFCLENNLLTLEPEGPKYTAVDLEGKSIEELRAMCQEEELPVKEPMLFGKRAYLEGLLLKVMQTPTGTRLFVEKKLNKLNALSEAMEYQLTRISHFKGLLDDSKLAEAEAELAEKEKQLSAQFKKQEYDKKMDAEEAEYAKRRAAAQQKKEELRQVKVQAQIDEIKAKRKAEKAEKEQHNSVRALPERTMGGDEDEDQEESDEVVPERFTAGGGTWIVTAGPRELGHKKREYVTVRDGPAVDARVLEYKVCREAIESVGVVTNELEQEWIKLAPPSRGYVLLTSPDPVFSDSHGLQGGGDIRTLERAKYRVGCNEYSQQHWQEHLDELLKLKSLHGHTLLYATFAPQLDADAQGDLGARKTVLLEWVHVQRELHRDGLLPAECAAALDAEGFEWDDKPWLFEQDKAVVVAQQARRRQKEAMALKVAQSQSLNAAKEKLQELEDRFQLPKEVENVEEEQVMIVDETSSNPLLEVVSSLVFANGTKAPQPSEPVQDQEEENRKKREEFVKSRMLKTFGLRQVLDSHLDSQTSAEHDTRGRPVAAARDSLLKREAERRLHSIELRLAGEKGGTDATVRAAGRDHQLHADDLCVARESGADEDRGVAPTMGRPASLLGPDERSTTGGSVSGGRNGSLASGPRAWMGKIHEESKV